MSQIDVCFGKIDFKKSLPMEDVQIEIAELPRSVILVAVENPKVTVLMAMYNSEKYLREAVDSILGQTFTDFELLIINDGSTDKSVEIIRSYNDSRIRMVDNPGNMGLVYTRNRGLKEAGGEYIAIFDSDDISYPTRLEEQVRFLDENKGFGIIGSWLEVIDENGTPTGQIGKFNLPPDKVTSGLLFNTVFPNPATTIRKSILKNDGYRDKYPVAEDYDLWVRLTGRTKAWNLQKPLVKYRVYLSSTTGKKSQLTEECTRQVILEQLNSLGISPSTNEMDIHRKLGNSVFDSDKSFIIEAGKWLLKLYLANKSAKRYSDRPFNEFLGDYWFAVCTRSTRHGLWTLKHYISSPLSSYANPGIMKKIRFFMKCVVKW